MLHITNSEKKDFDTTCALCTEWYETTDMPDTLFIGITFSARQYYNRGPTE